MSTSDGSELSDKAIKKLARQYQQDHPGVPYPVARREVLGMWRPLTVLVSDTGEQRLRISLEMPGDDGDGTHVGVLGPVGSGKTNLLTVMAESIRREPPSRGVEVIAVGDFLKESAALTAACDRVVGDDELGAVLTEVQSRRRAELEERGWHQNRVRSDDALPAIVILLDEPKGLGRDPGRELEWPLRGGRSLDVHMVIAWGAYAHGRQDPVGEWLPPEVRWWYPHLHSVIALSGPQRVSEDAEEASGPVRWAGRWHRAGDVDAVELAVPLASGE